MRSISRYVHYKQDNQEEEEEKEDKEEEKKNKNKRKKKNKKADTEFFVTDKNHTIFRRIVFDLARLKSALFSEFETLTSTPL